MDVSNGGDSTFTLRLSRQEMSYGSSRLISLREGPNVRQSFDGARLLTTAPRLNLDAFVTRPSTTERGVFDERPDPNIWFWVVYGVYFFPKLSGGLDLYYLGFVNKEGRFAQGTARERWHSIGTRWWGDPGAFHYNVEAVVQFGRFGRGRIGAGTVSAELGHTWKQSRLSRSFTVSTEYISSDRDSANANLRTFNPLFPKGAYFGQVTQIGPANLVDIHPLFTIQPTGSPTLTLRAEWFFFWRASRGDGLYTVPYELVRPAKPAR